LQRVALEAHELGLAGRDEVDLSPRGAVLEQAHDDVLVHERT
jgi:hypothetical protein